MLCHNKRYIQRGKQQNIEHNCVLQESVRRWQRYILLVKGGHCVEDWPSACKKRRHKAQRM